MSNNKPCDNCGRRRKLSHYTLSAGADTVALLLCNDCAEPIVALMAKGHSHPAPVKAHVVRPIAHSIVPVD